MTDSVIQRKTIINGYVALINYYYIIEDSIVNIYKTTIDYLYPQKLYITQGIGEFVIIGDDDIKEDIPTATWLNPMFMKSIHQSFYKPKYDYSDEKLESLGYKSLEHNSHFNESLWNCYIYSNQYKYDILSKFITSWNQTNLNIHLISGLYDPDEYELFSNFNIDMTLYPDITFHNTHLHEFNKDGLLEFIEKIKSERTWKVVTNMIIINNPQFTIDNDIMTQLTDENNMFIVFDTNLDNFNSNMEYISIPANKIEDFNKNLKDTYPPINSKDNINVLLSNPEFDPLMKHMNYIRI